MADVDGKHIASLLLRFFILYMPQLVQAGKVYKAIPPLYGIKNGKKVHYFTDQLDFVRYVQKSFITTNSLTYIDTKKEVGSKDITLLFMINEDYVYELERLAQTYAVDPRLLELALFEYIEKSNISHIRKSIKSNFRFMDVENRNGSFMYNGTIKETNFLYVNDRLVNDCQRLIKIINKNNSYYYYMNNEMVSIYQIMKKFEQTTPPGIQRYKG